MCNGASYMPLRLGYSLVSATTKSMVCILMRTGFILYLISRECVYFINVRQAYLLSPYYASRLSSRTVLFSCVPGDMQSNKKIRMIFGDSVKNVWIPREAEDLDKLVGEREQTANRLEKAELLLIRKANKAYRKNLNAGLTPSMHTQDVGEKPLDVSISSDGSVSPISTKSPITQTIPATALIATPPRAPVTPPDVNGSVAAQWIPAENRPRHRPLANYGRRVDTIKWTRDRLKVLAPKISKLRRQYRKGEGLAIPAVFVEFHTQVDAQSAYQTLAHHRANQMEPEIIGVRPQEIVWPSLYMSWMQRIVRRFLVQGFVTVLVIFWAIPAALAGFISNIKFLVKIPILSWLHYLPSVLLDLISGLLPALALMWLMSLVPGILRCMLSYLRWWYVLTMFSLRTRSWYHYRVKSRTFRPEFLLHLSGRPSLPDHDRHVSCVWGAAAIDQRSDADKKFIGRQSAESIEFLYLIFPIARILYECC